MKKSLDRGVVDNISLELGIDPSFIEKDWYAVQLLALIADSQVKLFCCDMSRLSVDIDLVFVDLEMPKITAIEDPAPECL